ncbi:Cullin-domain-containing protein [Flagelloscypha sp. PMI_526]|nr:Cullin-domain-containing protein [Flagelloscypha sp. PMI_526]
MAGDVPPPTDLPKCWAFLAEGVDHIMCHLQTGVSFSKYMSLYSVAYNYCTQTNSKYSGASHLAKSSTDFIGSDLYSRLIKYFVVHLKGVASSANDLQGEALINFYADEWDRYTMGANYVNRLFTYLNRHWVAREREEGRTHIFPVYTLALDQWRANLFIPIQQRRNRMTNVMLKLIESHRNGSVIDQGLVKKVVNSLVSIGIDRKDPDGVCLDVYTTEFQTPFLEATVQFYRKESETYLATHSVPEYLKKVEERLKEEEDRVDRYLNTSSRDLLVSVCEKTLLRAHRDKILSSVSHMLEFGKDDDLRRLYALVSRLGVKDGLTPLRKKFQEFLNKLGQSAVEKLIGEDAGSTAEKVDARSYADALLRVHRRGLEIVKIHFGDDIFFFESLDKACRRYINLNAVTGNSSGRSPELLVKFIDALLSKANKASEETVEASLNDVMTLFKYLDDKDIFQTFYTERLSKRLVYDLSASDEAEASMLTRLKATCGWDYTNKLERMFTEMKTGKEKTDNFKAVMTERYGTPSLSFVIMVGCTFLWPLNPPTHKFTVPAELRPTYDRFTSWYKEQARNHQLQWLWNHSSCELMTNYLNQKYIFMTSAYQTAILLQFNNEDTLSLEELITATELPKEEILPVLNLLCKGKVLLDGGDHQYDLNPNFKSKKIRVKLNQPIKSAVRKEEAKIRDDVEEHRHFAIQATVVRIMKGRKTMRNQPLIQEVVAQVSQRFVPKIPDIKKAIEVLLEKEYIERVGDSDLFTYCS